MPDKWKTIKIPADAYDEAVELRGTLMRSGVDALPEDLRTHAVGERGISIGTVVAMGLASLRSTLPRTKKSSRGR